MKQLQELFQKICAMSVKGRYALLAGCVGVIVLIDAVALMGLQLGLVSSTSKANKKIEDDVERVKADRERMVLMRQGLENSQTRLKEVGNKFRTIAEIPAVLEDISRIAVQQGVVIDQIQPQKENQEVLINTDTEKYFALPIVITARCSYHTFGRFLSKLEDANMLFTVGDLSMTGQEKEPYLHQVRITLRVILADKGVS